MGRVRPDGLARPAHDVGQLAGGHRLPEPAGLDRQGGRRLDHALVRGHAALPRARAPRQDLLQQRGRGEPAGLADHAGRARALLRPGREGDRLIAPARTPAAAGQQQLHGVRQRRREGRLPLLRHRPLRHQRRALRRAPGQRPGRLQLPGRQAVLEMVDGRARDPAGARHRQVRPAHRVAGRAGDPRRRRSRQRCALPRQGRQSAPAGGVGRLRRRQLDRDAAPAADERQRAAPGRAGQLLGPGRPQLHAPHHRIGLRLVRAAGAHVPRRDDGRDHRRRGPPRHLTRVRGRLLHGDVVARACRSWPRSSSPGSGAGSSRR